MLIVNTIFNGTTWLSVPLNIRSLDSQLCILFNFVFSEGIYLRLHVDKVIYKENEKIRSYKLEIVFLEHSAIIFWLIIIMNMYNVYV